VYLSIYSLGEIMKIQTFYEYENQFAQVNFSVTGLLTII